DEAHRFAVMFHRASRARRDLRSEIDAIAGIGPRKRRALLTAFGSVAGVRRATREELVRVVGERPADGGRAHFGGPSLKPPNAGRRTSSPGTTHAKTLIGQQFCLTLKPFLTPPTTESL